MRYAVPIVVALTLAAAACGQKDEGIPAIPTPSRDSMQNVPKAPVAPAVPSPTVAQPDLPKPGQANDHSSPTFRDGGASVPQK